MCFHFLTLEKVLRGPHELATTVWELRESAAKEPCCDLILHFLSESTPNNHSLSLEPILSPLVSNNENLYRYM